MTDQQRHRGRRPASSRATLVDAADELFLEQGYAATTIEQITRRAGVSRNTFFNYFAAKGDLLFAGVDDICAALAARLGEAGAAGSLAALRDAIVRTAAEVDVRRIPLAATQWGAMGILGEARAAGLARFATLAETMRRFLERGAADPGGEVGAAAGAGPQGKALWAQAAAYALTAASVAAGLRWLASGVGRGPLAGFIVAAVDPVCAGFSWPPASL
ncbi:MAG TPA: helix-turn-helix domain-containing protein [Microbacteriaceae bacterium]|nr:helix-turn-helix domain-containing protein [Microbacteriaceae bacterium]